MGKRQESYLLPGLWYFLTPCPRQLANFFIETWVQNQPALHVIFYSHVSLALSKLALDYNGLDIPVKPRMSEYREE